ncbi:MAG: hypothetical protein IPH76_18950 [Xanthomonadales bacterium]|nr:hypothetical protein [Xanthomonadales bacterium]
MRPCWRNVEIRHRPLASAAAGIRAEVAVGAGASARTPRFDRGFELLLVNC